MNACLHENHRVFFQAKGYSSKIICFKETVESVGWLFVSGHLYYTTCTECPYLVLLQHDDCGLLFCYSRIGFIWRRMVCFTFFLGACVRQCMCMYASILVQYNFVSIPFYYNLFCGQVWQALCLHEYARVCSSFYRVEILCDDYVLMA